MYLSKDRWKIRLRSNGIPNFYLDQLQYFYFDQFQKYIVEVDDFEICFQNYNYNKKY